MSSIKYWDLVGTPGRHPSLDGLRGLAIIAVLMRHAVHGWPQPLDGIFWNPWYNGWLGVELFFALSGFLIIHHLIAWWPKSEFSGFIRTYFSKRALRIIPIYTISLLIGVLGLIPFYETPQPVTVNTITYHILFIQEYFYSTIAVPLWSVGVEEKFYLVAPLIVFSVIRMNGKKLLQLLACVATLILITKGIAITLISPSNYSQYFWQYRAPFHYSVINILVGGTVATFIHAFPNRTIEKKKLRAMSAFCVFILGFLLIPFNWHEIENWLAVDFAALICSACFSLLIYCGIHSSLIGLSFFESKLLRFFARISYPLYATHIMLIPWALHGTARVQIDSEYLRYFFFLGLYLVLSILIASLLHLAVEKPFLLMKERIQYKDSHRTQDL